MAVFDEADRAQRWEGPEWEAADEAFGDRHFYRGADKAEVERLREGRSVEAYGEMWGPSEWLATGELADWDVRDRLPEIDVPTLVIRGAYDLCTPPVAKTLVDGIRGARLVVFEESSHTPVLEETERYLATVPRVPPRGGTGVAARGRPLVPRLSRAGRDAREAPFGWSTFPGPCRPRRCPRRPGPGSCRDGPSAASGRR